MVKRDILVFSYESRIIIIRMWLFKQNLQYLHERPNRRRKLLLAMSHPQSASDAAVTFLSLQICSLSSSYHMDHPFLLFGPNQLTAYTRQLKRCAGSSRLDVVAAPKDRQIVGLRRAKADKQSDVPRAPRTQVITAISRREVGVVVELQHVPLQREKTTATDSQSQLYRNTSSFMAQQLRQKSVDLQMHGIFDIFPN